MSTHRRNMAMAEREIRTALRICRATAPSCSKLNASIHPDALGPLKLTGSFKRADGSTGAVDVLVGTNIWATGTDGSVTRDPKTMGCIQQNQRLWRCGRTPRTSSGRWALWK